MEQQPSSDAEVKNNMLASSSTSVWYYRQPASKSVIVYNQMPPESHETVIEIASLNRVGNQMHSGSAIFDGVDHLTLSKLVPEKRLVDVNKFGGVKGLGDCLKTDLERGIRGGLEERTIAFGTNSYCGPPAQSFLPFVWVAFKDPLFLLLLACSAVSLGIGIKVHGPKDGWYDSASIFVAVFLVIFITAVVNFKQYKQINKHFKIKNNVSVEVVRDGKRRKVTKSEVVVGEVVCLNIGDQVPADGLFINGYSLKMDESSMTGESDHVEIDSHKNPFLISGTKVVDGWATMLVTSVGMSTSWGEMMTTISRNSDEQTPLQSRLKKLTLSLGQIGLAVAFVILVVLSVHYFTGNTKDENGIREFHGSKTKVDNVSDAIVGIIAVAVAIVVAAFPEGLPLAVTLTLAYSMRRMMAGQALVRKLSACETMGSATTICTDKTGSLTQNRMIVTEFWQGISMEGRSYTQIAKNVLEFLHQGIGLNTTGSVYKSGVSGTNLEISGSPTEKAILSWAVLELDMDMKAVRKKCVIQHVEAFSSERKRSGMLMKKVEDDTLHVHWKGAAEMILAMCSHYYDLQGNVRAINGNDRTEFDQKIQVMAASSLRCMAFAHKQVSEVNHASDGKSQENIQETGLTLLGLVGLKDPSRPGVKRAVQDCQAAGVSVKMITGDNIFKAKAIAMECGILSTTDQGVNDESMVEGVEFRNYTEEERMEKVDKIRVLARSSPLDKLLMVQCLKNKGHVVAVTGDCTNDAPALREADIGLALGIKGTEVAKESSDIIILDDNFASVAYTLRWGRCVYNNIQKFIQFQLTMNVVAVVIISLAAFSTGKTPLTPAQLIWVNLIMDTLGAFALVTEKPSRQLMYKPPRGHSDPLITNIMWRNIICQALYQIAAISALEFKGKSIFGIKASVNHTLIFNTFVLCQIFNQFNARGFEEVNVFRGILKSKLFLVITGIAISFQVIIVEILNKLAHTERLDWMQWGVCVGIAAFSWPIGLLIKFLPVPSTPMLSCPIIRKPDDNSAKSNTDIIIHKI